MEKSDPEIVKTAFYFNWFRTKRQLSAELIQFIFGILSRTQKASSNLLFSRKKNVKLYFFLNLIMLVSFFKRFFFVYCLNVFLFFGTPKFCSFFGLNIFSYLYSINLKKLDSKIRDRNYFPSHWEILKYNILIQPKNI